MSTKLLSSLTISTSSLPHISSAASISAADLYLPAYQLNFSCTRQRPKEIIKIGFLSLPQTPATMKFSHLGSALFFGAAVSAQNAAVYDLSADQQSYGPVMLKDSLLYFADKLGVSRYYSIGNSESTFDFLAHVHKDASSATKAPLVVIVNGVAEPAAFFSEAKPTFEIELGAHQKRAPELVEALFDVMPKQMAHNGPHAEISLASGSLKSVGPQHHDAWKQKIALVFKSSQAVVEIDSTKGNQHALGLGDNGASLVHDRLFLAELQQLQGLAAAELDVPVVFAVDLIGAVAKRTGYNSAAYKLAASTFSSALQAASSVFDVTVVVMASETAKACHGSNQKRSTSAPAFAKRGVASAKSCYSDQAACQTSTNDCSSHGACVEVQTDCWQCACAPTYDKKAAKTTKWAGADCSKKDLSAPAHLLLWTTIVLVGTMVVGVKLLFSVGSESLPGVLEAATVKRSA